MGQSALSSQSDTKLRGADIAEGSAATQSNLNRQHISAVRNNMKFNRENCKVLHVEKNRPVYQYMVGVS